MKSEKTNIMDLNSIISLIINSKDKLNNYSVKSLALFGSYSRNSQNNMSDIDILVNFNRNTFRNFIGLKDFLESLLNHKIDLVCENSLKDIIKPYILNDAIWLVK